MRFDFLKNKNFLIILFIIFYFVLVIPQITGLFVGDEVDFINAARGVVTSGIPIYEGAGNVMKIGLWHPTLYVNILATSFKLFGVHEWSARTVSVLFTLLTFSMIYLIMKEFSLSDTSKVLASSIFLFNPLVVQGSLLVDIDNSVLMFFIALFVYTYVKLDRTNPKNLVFLGILFAIALWAKIPTPPVLILSIVIFHALNREYKRALLESTTIGLVGGVIFLVTWFLYCNFFDLPFSEPFIHNIGYVGFGQNNIHFLLTHLWGFKNILFWTTPFFLLLMLTAAISRAKRYLEKRKLEVIDFIFIVGLLIFIEYLIVGSYQTADFPRYFSPMMPMFSIAFAGYLDKVKEITRRDLNAAVFVSIILILYLSLALKDPLLIDRVIFNTEIIYKIVKKSVAMTLLYLFPFVLSYVIFRALKVKSAFTLSIILPLLICSTYIDCIQVKADYATAYLYGERGMEDTIDYLSPRTDDNDTVIAKKDIAYYLAIKEFYDLPKSAEELEKLIENRDIEYIILKKEGYFTSLKYKDVTELIDTKYELDKEFGDYKVYKIG